MSLTPQFYPSLDPRHTQIMAPVAEVVVLEDRAQVTRRALLRLRQGAQKLRIMGVAPVLQDVSLRAEVTQGQAQVTDLRARRCARVTREELPEELRALEASIEDLVERLEDIQQDKRRASARYQSLLGMLTRGLAEVPLDVAWGVAQPQSWHDNFQTLFSRARILCDQVVEHHFAWKELHRELLRLEEARRLGGRPDQRTVACLELDVVASEEGAASLEVTYVVPNALWRPTHRARLVGDQLHFTLQAALWQNTGEDWNNVELTFSTAQASLGTEPPALRDDLLDTQRRQEQVTVQEREVDIQSTGPGGAAPDRGVKLPGVDDGGEVRNLKPQGPCSVPSDGQPHFIPVGGFVAPTQTSQVCYPQGERAPRAFLKCVQANTGPQPVLAGPVELVRDSGPVGWTQVGYVAPGETFALGFGPQSEVRVRRLVRQVSDKVDAVDKWRHQIEEVTLYVSNLCGEPRALSLVERIPVSEIEHVRVDVLEQTQPAPAQVDDNGFCHWTLALAAHERAVVRLRWRLSSAPDVVQA